MRRVLDGIHVVPLEFHVRLDEVLAEDIALQQEFMIGFQRLQRFTKRPLQFP